MVDLTGIAVLDWLLVAGFGLVLVWAIHDILTKFPGGDAWNGDGGDDDDDAIEHDWPWG